MDQDREDYAEPETTFQRQMTVAQTIVLVVIAGMILVVLAFVGLILGLTIL